MNDDDESGQVALTRKGIRYVAKYDCADGNVYLNYPGYKKAPAKILGTAKRTALTLLRELVREIEIGTARKSD